MKESNPVLAKRLERRLRLYIQKRSRGGANHQETAQASRSRAQRLASDPEFMLRDVIARSMARKPAGRWLTTAEIRAAYAMEC